MERVDLGETEHTVLRWWVRGKRGDLDHGVIGIGRLGDGRWFCARAGRGENGAWIAGDERQACDAVSSWITRRGGPGLWPEVKPAQEATRPAPAHPNG